MTAAPGVRHLLAAKDLADFRYFEAMSVADMAAPPACRRPISAGQFTRTFGESPHQYLLTRRLERAAALLRTTDWSVPRICFAVGLGSLGSFTTSFRRMFGETPTAYRDAWPSGRVAGPNPAVRGAGLRPPDRTARFEKTGRGVLLRLCSIDRSRRTDDEDRQHAVLGARPGRSARLLYQDARVGGAVRRHHGGMELPLAGGGAGRSG